MRLTLRTILAYLDDVLEPAQAREIGDKIADSKEAADLMSRIRDVMRRRRIGAPELAGPGSGPDPNMVSDYLENLLPAGEVVELEKLCQASDVHLAEVAACHKILSMVMGQPIDVSDEMRERMYALGAAKAPAELSGSASLPAMAEGMTGVETEIETGLPEYLTRQSFMQKYGALSLVLVSTFFWIVLLWTDDALWSRQPIAEVLAPQKQQGTALAPAVAVQPPRADVAQPAPNNLNSQIPGAAPALAAANSGNVVANPQIVPPLPMPAAPLPTNESGNPAIASTAPAMPAIPGSNPQAAPPLPPTPNLPPAAVRETLPESPFTYQSGDEFVIKKLAAQPDWLVYPINVSMEVDDELASPPPFRNTYGIVNVVDVSLEPGTRIRRLPRTDATTFGLQLDRGQLTLLRPLTSAQPVTLELLAAGQSWKITFLDPGTQIAVELSLPTFQGIPTAATRLTPGGGIVVISGRIQISSMGQPDLELKEKDGYARWPAEGTALVLRADLGVPGWAQPGETLITPAARQLSRLFQKEFIADRMISECIGPVVNDRRAGISELAVKTLAMIDQYPFLVAALQSDHQESRLAAIRGLREWLGEDPEKNQELLHQELGKVFRDEHVVSLERLLWGFSDKDARDPNVSRQLVDWMKDDQIAIRQLAFEIVSRFVGKTYDYLPMAPPAERRAALVRWEESLKRNGGTLLPIENPPMP